MDTTDQISCNILADLLIAHGVRNVVLSPGRRNAPMVIALSRRTELNCYTVVDERSAAFIALGMSLQTGVPVAMVCTSGTALLNYAPGVAEAFYRGVPLIVISADRPLEWIDQDDSQTIWQQNALAPYVKRSCDIGAYLNYSNGEWFCNRVINDLLIEANNGRKGPVHINIRLDAPLDKTMEFGEGQSRVIRQLSPSQEFVTRDARRLSEMLASPRKVLVIVGFHEPDERLNKALTRLAKLPNVAVMTETIANLHSPLFINRIDATLCRMSLEEMSELKPDVVITVGGALVSRHVKEWIRSIKDVEHWHVGISHTTIDCFRHLSLRIEMDAAIFMRQLASALQIYKADSNYSISWHNIFDRAKQRHSEYIADIPWSDMKAFSYLISKIPSDWNLHLSNGTPIRYAQLMDCSHIHRCECNRGVSGIDGCTSTAVGSSYLYRDTTLLISGDMSCQYDISALSSGLVTPRFKMVVICNGGGGIFRFIQSTSALPELEKYFVVGVNLPLSKLAEGYGFSYFEASSMNELQDSFHRFIACDDSPAILAIYTPGITSAEVLKRYFVRD